MIPKFARLFGSRDDAEPVTREFELHGLVNKMECDLHSPLDNRPMAIIELYSEDPIMINGETEHLFTIHVPNYSCMPRVNSNRMTFWACYGFYQPVEVDMNGVLYVPPIDQAACDYFTHRHMSFKCVISRLTDGHEIMEYKYLKRG